MVKSVFGGENHNLFEKIISLENLTWAWLEFRRGKRQKADVGDFEFNLEQNLLELHQELKNKVYRCMPYAEFYVEDPKLRHIHKAQVRDRVVHQAYCRILYPIFDRLFIFDSYSCRVGKGTHSGVGRLEQFCRKASHNYRRNVFGLKCDIRKFFDNIDHTILIRLIRRSIGDPEVLWLTDIILNSFEKSPGKGLPLGNVTSQWFANLYLNEFDQFIKHKLKQKYFLRYCDDFFLLGLGTEELQALLPKIKHFLASELKLELHPQKIVFRKLTQGFDFLGYIVLPYRIQIRTKTKKRIFRKLDRQKELLKQGNISKKTFLQSFQSYLGILSHCKGRKVRQVLKNSFL